MTLARGRRDLLGSGIYGSSPTHGFLYCVIATTAVYALILPLIVLVPKELIATADGEANPKVEAEILKDNSLQAGFKVPRTPASAAGVKCKSRDRPPQPGAPG
jgi:hypothetical protein